MTFRLLLISSLAVAGLGLVIQWLPDGALTDWTKPVAVYGMALGIGFALALALVTWAVAMRQINNLTLTTFRLAQGRNFAGIADAHPFLQLRILRRLHVALNALLRRAKHTQLRVNRLAFFDPMTGLANRECFRRRAHAYLVGAKPGDEAALLLIDLDGFKTVNAAMGHDAGDDVLGQVGARLRELLVVDTVSPERTILTNYRSDPTVARLGGDVFGIFLPNAGICTALSLAERVRRRLGIPFPREEGNLRLGVSIGLATSPNDALDYAGLLKAAENATYSAKLSGKNRVCVAGAASDGLTRAASVALHSGDLASDFTLLFEPFFQTSDMGFAGVEAVMCCPTAGDADRAAEGWFTMLADMGLLCQAHHDAFDEAIEVLRHLLQDMSGPQRLTLRIPASLLLDDAFLTRVSDLLPLPFELSFAVFLTPGSAASMTKVGWAIDRLSEAGVAFTLDNFGSEEGALTAMIELAPHFVRFDQRLTGSVARSVALADMTGTLVGMARAVDIGAVAQGVATPEELTCLKQMGVAYVQGPALSDLLTAGDLAEYLRNDRVACRV